MTFRIILSTFLTCKPCRKYLLMIIVLLLGFHVQGQIRFIQVNPTTDVFTIKNFGGTLTDISDYRVCSKFVYSPNPLSNLSIISGSLSLAPGASVTLSGFSLDESGADFGLYFPASAGGFTSASAMADFVQWEVGGQGREPVAVTKGIWTAGTFVSGGGTYSYTGNGTDIGPSFWKSSVIVRVAHLNGNQENPPVLTLASGTVTANFDDFDSTLTISGSFSGLKGNFTATHIHIGYAGQNGGVVFPLTASLDPDMKGGSYDPNVNSFTLDSAQTVAFLSRRYYANVHSTYSPSGEIRGQLVGDAEEYFYSHLYGSNQNSGLFTEAAGAVIGELNGFELTLSGSFSNLKGNFAANVAGGAHLHKGLAGQGGGIEVPLNADVSTGLKAGVFAADSNVLSLSTEQIDLLRGRNLYANIHSTEYPSGEIRGQLHGMALAVFRGHFSGANENPPVTTEAGGQALLEILGDTSLVVSGSFRGLEGDFTATHIHTAIAGSNGGVTIPLTALPDTSDRNGVYLSSSNTYDIDSAGAANLMRRRQYMNVHSTASPSGEIRAQILPEGMYFMHGNISGSQVRTPLMSSGSGTVKAEVRGSNLTVSGSFSGLGGNYTNSHIHLGAVGVNGGVSFPLKPNLDGDFRGGDFEADSNVFSLSPAQLEFLKDREFYVNVHSTVSPSGEIRGQLLKEAAAYFVSTLSGTSERNPVNTGGYGKVIVELDGNKAVATGSFTGLENDFNGGSHIHGGLPGQNGGVLIPLDANVNPDNRSGIFKADSNTFTLSAGMVDSLRGRMLYTNVHSIGNPSGEIRGNLLNQAQMYFTTSMSGKNASNPVDSDGTGGLKLELTGNRLLVSGSFSNLTGDFNSAIAGGAHLHIAAPGSNGGISVPLNATLDVADLKKGAFLADSNAFVLDSAQMANLKSGNMYANIHTTEVGSGEIRGQILPEINFFPSDPPVISAPASGDTLEIAGDDSSPFTSSWTESVDGTALAYIWQLSDTTDFSRLLIQDNVGDQLMFTTDFKTIDSILAQQGVNIGDTIKVYHRAIASDGAVCTVGMLDSVWLVRGMVTALDPDIWAGLDVNLYPNPATDIVQLHIISDQYRELTLVLKDIYGKTIKEEKIQVSAGDFDHRINITPFSGGMYFLQLKMNQQFLPAFKLYKQ